MKRIFRFYYLFLIPFFLIRLAFLSQTDTSTGFFAGERFGRHLFFFSFVVAVVIAVSATIRFMRKQVVPVRPGSPALGMQILFSITALLSLQQILIPPLTSHISSFVLSVGIFIFYSIFHLLSATFFFILSTNSSLPSTLMSDLFASSPAISFTAQMFFLYAQKPINIHDTLSILSLLCEASLSIAWLRYCSALLAGNYEAFPSAVGFSVLAMYLAIGFRLPELLYLPGTPSFLRFISIMHHVFSALTLSCMVLGAISEPYSAKNEEQELNDGEDNV